MEVDTIGTIAQITRGVLEERGYGTSFGHDPDERHEAFFVTNPASGRILAEVVIKVPDLSASQSEEPTE